MKKTSKSKKSPAKPIKKKSAGKKVSGKKVAGRKPVASSKLQGKLIAGSPMPMMLFHGVPQQPGLAGEIETERPLIGEPLPSFASKLRSRGIGTRSLTTKEIFGHDDRQPVADPFEAPYRWICFLRSTTSGNVHQRGTAFLIAPNLALTAAHCIYPEEGGQYLTVNLWPAHDGSTPDFAHAIWVSHIYVPPAWLNSGRRQTSADFAALVLERSVPNGHFAAAHYEDDDFDHMLLHIAGFPADKSDYTMREHFGPSTSADPQLVYHQIDTKGGQSGAPIFIYDQSTCYAVAVHTGQTGDNRGTRINRSVLQQLEFFATNHGT